MPESARLFPIQDGPDIPWAEAEKAYDVYVSFFGSQQSMATMAGRGGFSVGEIACLSRGHNPWRCSVNHNGV